MRRILLLWACNVVAIWVADLLIDGINIADPWRVIVIGAVFGLVNWLVKPIVTLFSLPLIILTLGIALFFVNLFMLYITSWILPSFEINSFGAAIGATIVIWFVNVILQSAFGLNRDKDDKRR
ncbi:MAG TPA: phage holin family protein [Acidimicrobiia bacterium]|nr:phage holin family protein [Acidimicrobiia bacterium]